MASGKEIVVHPVDGEFFDFTSLGYPGIVLMGRRERPNGPITVMIWNGRRSAHFTSNLCVVIEQDDGKPEVVSQLVMTSLFRRRGPSECRSVTLAMADLLNLTGHELQAFDLRTSEDQRLMHGLTSDSSSVVVCARNPWVTVSYEMVREGENEVMKITIEPITG